MTPLLLMCQILGFLLQTSPVAFLFFLPFGSEELRLPLRATRLITLAAPLAASLGYVPLSLAFYADGADVSPELASVSNLYMLAFIAAWLIFFFWNARVAVAAKLLLVIVLLHYAAILFLLNTIIYQALFTSMGWPYIPVMYPPFVVLLSLLLIVVTFPLISLFLFRVVAPVLPVMNRRDLIRGCLYFSAALLIFFICAYLLAFSNPSLTNMTLLTALAGLTVTDMIVYYTFFSEIRLALRNQQLADQLRLFDKQYRVFSGSVAEARRFRHDLRQHLNVISELNHLNKRDELADYLNRYTQTYRSIESQPLSGFPAVDNILRYYLNRAQAEGIRMDANPGALGEGLGFDPTDMTVLLGNLLENALEACQALPQPEERYLRVSLRKRDAALLILVENSCPGGDPETSGFCDGSFFASTKGPALRGLGLRSVQLVADKYGGSAEYKRAGGVFTARVVLNIPPQRG